MSLSYSKSAELQAKYQRIAEEHAQSDLTLEDRTALKSASSAIGTHVTVGALLGSAAVLALGLRSRNRFAKFAATIRTAPIYSPTQVRPVIPGNGASVGWPSFLGLFALGSLGGILGGEFGLLTGAYHGRRILERDGNMERIVRAMKKTHVDLLRQQADDIEKGIGKPEGWGLE